jgi:hypothetical protein
MNEANTLADITGQDEQLRASDDGMRAAPTPPDSPVVDEAIVIGFCGYLTADIPELHGIHPQKLADSWERFKARVAEGFDGLQFEHENGDGR